MNGHDTNWMPGLIVLGAGLVAALIFLFSSRKRVAPTPPPSNAADLESRYQGLLGQLKEHQANKHLVTAADWDREQSRLEQLAAATLRERDGVKHEELKAEARAQKIAPQTPAQAAAMAQNQTLKGALWGAGVVLFFVALGYGLSHESTNRADGQTMTGRVPPGGMQGGQQQPEEDPALKRMMAQVQAQPDDVDVLADAAAELIRRQMFDDAAPLVQRATAIDPYHLKNRINRAVLEAVDGKTMQAMTELQHLGATYDDAYDAHLFAGMLAMDVKDLKTARSELTLYVNQAPPMTQPPMIRAAIAQIDQELAKKP